MVLEIIWASAFTLLAIYAGIRRARYIEDYRYDQAVGGWEVLLLFCYVLALYLLNDLIGAPLWRGLLDTLPQPGTPIQMITAGVICYVLAAAGLLVVGWLGFQWHHQLRARAATKLKLGRSAP